MERLSFDLPAMYGDHHVLEVRRILLEMPGVKAVNASSCFQIAEVQFDPTLLDVETIKSRLEEAGYLGDLTIPHEVPGTTNGNGKVGRATRAETLYQQSNGMVTFAQTVGSSGPSRWPCPGMGVLGETEKGET